MDPLVQVDRSVVGVDHQLDRAGIDDVLLTFPGSAIEAANTLVLAPLRLIPGVPAPEVQTLESGAA